MARSAGEAIQATGTAVTDDKALRLQFCTEMQQHLVKDGFAEKLIFSGEATFHPHGMVNGRNVHVWGTENPRFAVQHIRNSL